MSSPCTAYAWQKINVGCLSGLGVSAPDLLLVGIVVETIDIVGEVGDQSIGGDVALSCRRQDFVEFFGGEIELVELVGVAGIGPAIGLGPQFTVDVRMQSVDHGEPRVGLVPVGREIDR